MFLRYVQLSENAKQASRLCPLTLGQLLVRNGLAFQALLAVAAIRCERHRIEPLYGNLLPTTDTFSERPLANSFQCRLNLSKKCALLRAVMEQQLPREICYRAIPEILWIISRKATPFFLDTREHP
jgi:hypothetical protein